MVVLVIHCLVSKTLLKCDGGVYPTSVHACRNYSLSKLANYCVVDVDCCRLSVCVFVNRGCDCGPVLNSRLVSQLPTQFGPGSIRRVLRAAVQSCVDCSPDQSTIYNLLREGTGRVVITGQYC